MASRPTCLVFSSGAARGIAHFGAVRALSDRGLLKAVDCCVGTSAGAIAAASVALGLPPHKVLRRAVSSPLPGLDPTLENWKSGFGVGSDALLDWSIEVALGKRADLCLGEVPAVRGIRLVVVTSDLSSARATYLSDKTHPQLRVRDALKMSCAIPFLFGARDLAGGKVVDGALTDWFPLARGVEEAGGAADRVLGVQLRTESGTRGDIDGSDLATFVFSLIECAMRSQKGADVPDARVLTVLFPRKDKTMLEVTPQWMRDAYERGRRAAGAFAWYTEL